MRKFTVIVGILVAFYWLRYFAQPQDPPGAGAQRPLSVEDAPQPLELFAPAVIKQKQLIASNVSVSRSMNRPVNRPVNPEVEPVVVGLGSVPTATQRVVSEPRIRNKRQVHFEIDDGLAVADGDIVLGVPASSSTATSGTGALPITTRWPSRQIPYYVQPGFPNPERVDHAIQLFSGTPMHFVPYTTEEDVLVFQEGQGNCKSYVGRIGGKQPVWLSAGCGAPQIAHEMMHAIGFIHEQNRSDRDQSITVNFENIDENHRFNFEKMSNDMMRLSGLSDFDFTSLMIYTDTEFSKNGQVTMRSLELEQRIDPANSLSAKDIQRLVRAYGVSAEGP